MSDHEKDMLIFAAVALLLAAEWAWERWKAYRALRGEYDRRVHAYDRRDGVDRRKP